MWQIIVVALVILAALIYVIRSLARSAKGDTCRCGTGSCSLKDHHPTDRGSLPCQTVSPAISADSLEESARNLSAKAPRQT